MDDNTQSLRKQRTSEINFSPKSREQLESEYGDVWNTSELQQDFIVHSFFAPFISVTRKSDGEEGTLEFQHSPRYYFHFRLEDG
jgi:hypothetical protein